MGNSSTRQPSHLLELRIAYPSMKIPLGKGGQPCVIFARVGTLEDFGNAGSVLWNQPMVLPLEASHSQVCIVIYAAEPGCRSLDEAVESGEARPLTDVCIPYAGRRGLVELGLKEDGPELSLNFALAIAKKGRSGSKGISHRGGQYITLTVRELPAPAGVLGESAQHAPPWELPPARKQVIALELQNEQLRGRRQRQLQLEEGALPGGSTGGAASSIPGNSSGPRQVPNHVRQLQVVIGENEQFQHEIMLMRRKLSQVTAALKEDISLKQTDVDWGKQLRINQQELRRCSELQNKMREHQEEKIKGLKAQLRQAGSDIPLSSGNVLEQEVLAMQNKIVRATAKRDNLIRRLEEAREAVAESQKLSSSSYTCNPVVQTLMEENRQRKAEIEVLQQDLASAPSASEGSSQRQQEMQMEVQRFYDELDLLHRTIQDERVRTDSEVKELKKERDALKDQHDDELAKLQGIRFQSQALQDLRARLATLDKLHVGDEVISLIDYDGKSGTLCKGDRGVIKGPCTDDAADKSQRFEVEFPNYRSVNLAPAQFMTAKDSTPKTDRGSDSFFLDGAEQAKIQSKRARNAELALELEQLRACEDDRTNTVQELEDDQDEIMEAICKSTAQAGFQDAKRSATTSGTKAKALEVKAWELEQKLARAKAVCEAKHAEVVQTRARTQEAMDAGEALRKHYMALQQSEDDRVWQCPSLPRSSQANVALDSVGAAAALERDAAGVSAWNPQQSPRGGA